MTDLDSFVRKQVCDIESVGFSDVTFSMDMLRSESVL